jgi:hypothetical protein
MKYKIILLLTGIASVLFSLISCHTETPLGIDNQNPEAEILMIYNSTDTLYNALDSLLIFTDFSDTLLTDQTNIKISVSDNNELYKVCLVAEDYFTGFENEIKTVKDVNDGALIMSVNYKDFPVVQDAPFQKFYLKINVYDESENKKTTTKSGFYITKPYPMNLFYDELGLIKEIQGDSVDFREKHGKLAFIQFMTKGCLSCVEEAQDMKVMYSDTSYDLTQYSHSLFGSEFSSEADFLSFKTRDQKLPFDCFLDEAGSVKGFFETLIGRDIENEVFAVLPTGKIIAYDYLAGSFTDWIHLMYETAYPNIK